MAHLQAITYYQKSLIVRLFFILFILPIMDLTGQVNYDENLVPNYELPNLLASQSGDGSEIVQHWEDLRRSEILNQFKDQMYGIYEDEDLKVDFKVIKYSPTPQLKTVSICQQVEIILSKGVKKTKIGMLIYIPKKTIGPAPVFLGLNFFGNHTIQDDPNILITESWVANNESFSIDNNKATDASRGVREHRWPVDEILSRGYALATIYYGDIDPDFDDGFENGIHSLLENPDKAKLSAISAWAYGLSKAMDYFEIDSSLDSERVAVIGHSRLGKASLWAGALDDRFSLVISNNSGCGGAALSKREFGETVEIINTNFPHWFNAKYKEFSANETEMPFDQHMLLSLIAPRPLYVASAEEDRWADPYGEYLSLFHASQVYSIYGNDIMTSIESPAVNSPMANGKLGYHIRSGKHDLTIYDWQQYLDFADKQLK